jgi:hypothetical protein
VVKNHYISLYKVSGLVIIFIYPRRIVHYVPIICTEKNHSIILKRSYKSELVDLQNQTISTKYLVVRNKYLSFYKVNGLFIILISPRSIFLYVPIICTKTNHSKKIRPTLNTCKYQWGQNLHLIFLN